MLARAARRSSLTSNSLTVLTLPRTVPFLLLLLISRPVSREQARCICCGRSARTSSDSLRSVASPPVRQLSNSAKRCRGHSLNHACDWLICSDDQGSSARDARCASVRPRQAQQPHLQLRGAFVCLRARHLLWIGRCLSRGVWCFGGGCADCGLVHVRSVMRRDFEPGCEPLLHFVMITSTSAFCFSQTPELHGAPLVAFRLEVWLMDGEGQLSSHLLFCAGVPFCFTLLIRLNNAESMFALGLARCSRSGTCPRFRLSCFSCVWCMLCTQSR